jgi:hypothetical protein
VLTEIVAPAAHAVAMGAAQAGPAEPAISAMDELLNDPLLNDGWSDSDGSELVEVAGESDEPFAMIHRSSRSGSSSSLSSRRKSKSSGDGASEVGDVCPAFLNKGALSVFYIYIYKYI